MMSAYSSVLFCTIVMIWTFSIETNSTPAGWCYQCDSRDPRCQLDVDSGTMNTHRIPCNGQCYTRVVEDRLSRGCSWEYGFMSRQNTLTPIFEKNAMWIFCDTALCNARANVV